MDVGIPPGFPQWGANGPYSSCKNLRARRAPTVEK